jgi:hypothetical protein
LNNQQNLDGLLKKYVENRCTPKEAETVLAWLEADEYGPEQQELISRLLSGHSEMNTPPAEILQQQLENSFENILQKIEEKENAGGKLRRIPWLRYAAAAALIIIVGSGAYLLLQQKTLTKEIAKDTSPKQINKDLAPGGNKAILTLADGKQIVLNDAKNGSLGNQGNTKIIKLDGQLTYNKTGNSAEVIYNTITTPRGGQYQIILADGSKIWLN